MPRYPFTLQIHLLHPANRLEENTKALSACFCVAKEAPRSRNRKSDEASKSFDQAYKSGEFFVIINSFEHSVRLVSRKLLKLRSLR